MTDKPGVVLTAGDFQALAVLRSMSRRGIPVLVADHEHNICRYSRFRHRTAKAPPPSDDVKYADFLVDLARRENLDGWMLLPNNDACVHAISRHKARLDSVYRVPLPDHEVIKKVYVKRNTYDIAQRYGIPAPRLYRAANLEQLMSIPITFPVVVKPSVRDHFYSKVKIKGFKVDDRQQLDTVYRRVCKVIGPDEVIVQEFIPGGAEHLYSFCPFFKNGRTVGGVMARRSRQHPMDFGHASTFAELVDIPELRHAAENFLTLISYYGIAEVEFMFDKRDCQYKLIEVNPRIWGWHSLAIGAGVDLPYLLYCDATNGGHMRTDPIFPEEPLKWVRLVTDIPTVAMEVGKRRMSLRHYANSMRGKKVFAVLDPGDPLPFLAELCMLPYLWVKRRF